MVFILPPNPRLARSVDEEFHSETSLHLHVVDVHTAAHPHIFEKCDKEFYNKDGLQKHMADVHDQCEEDAEAEFDFDMEEKSTQIVHISPVCVSCQLRIINQNEKKTM